MSGRVGRFILAGLFIVSASLHFAVPALYVRIVPPTFPHPGALVLISGVAEFLGGVGLLIPQVRRLAAYGLGLLLVAVFPANIYMAVAHVPATGLLGNHWLQWLRLPLQFPLIWWALRYTQPEPRSGLRTKERSKLQPRLLK